MHVHKINLSNMSDPYFETVQALVFGLKMVSLFIWLNDGVMYCTVGLWDRIVDIEVNL